MRHLLGVLGPTVLLVAVTALSVEQFDDRALLVPPPDACAEGFVREVLTGRYDRAREYVVDPDRVSNGELKTLRAQLGESATVEPEIRSGDDSRASVGVTVEKGSWLVPMTWDEGQWRVAALPTPLRPSR
jgi:hypothetical protein